TGKLNLLATEGTLLLEADTDQSADLSANKHWDAKCGHDPQSGKTLYHDWDNWIGDSVPKPVMPASVWTIRHAHSRWVGIDLAEKTVLAAAKKILSIRDDLALRARPVAMLVFPPAWQRAVGRRRNWPQAP